MQKEVIQEELNSIWNGWTLKEKLGQGSFGSVYRIERQEFGRIYESALKVITIPLNQAEIDSLINDGMDDESIRMYLSSVVDDIINEFALMYKLRGNSNIVGYEDHSVIEHKDGIGWNIYIRMELLTPLFDYVKHRKLTIRDVIRMGIDICNALELCQKYNIVHRDIKPENTFVSDFGTFKLGDFGIARQMERTSTNMSKKGTYTYMAPELYKGEECNSTVDIYSLGIVLYRFLNNNRTPFLPPYPQPLRITDKERANVLRMSGTAMPKPCNAEGRLAEIVLKACAYDPKDRYESATLMKEALENVLYSDNEANLIYPEGDQVNKDHEFSVSLSNGYSDVSGKSTDSLNDIDKTEDSSSKGSNEDEKEENLQKEDEVVSEDSIFYLFKTDVMEKKEKDNLKEELIQRAKQREAIDNMDSHSQEEEDMQNEDDGEDSTFFTDVVIPDVRSEDSTLRDFDAPDSGSEDFTPTDADAPDSVSSDSPKEDNHKKKQEKEKKGGSAGKILGGIAILALLAAGGGYGGYTYYQKTLEREVPSFANMTLEAAKTMAAGDDESLIVIQSGEEYSDTVEKGDIISQDVAEGTILKKGDEIKVIISKGALKEVPEITGKKKETAEELVAKVNLKYSVADEKYSDDVEKGRIISQDPAAGATIEEFETVSVVVSKGIEQVEVPKVTGKTLEKAKNVLKEAKLKFGSSSEEYSNDVEEGKIISQSIEAGKKVDKNKKVNVVVSLGKKPVPTTQAKRSTSRSSSSSKKKSSGGSSSSSGGGGGSDVSTWDVVN